MYISTIRHQLIDTDSRNTQQLRRRVACILSAAWPDCTQVRHNPPLAVRMAVLVLCFSCFFLVEVYLGLFGFDAQVSAKFMQRRGEVDVSISIVLVYMLKRKHKRNPSSGMIGSGKTTEKPGNKHGDRLCKE